MIHRAVGFGVLVVCISLTSCNLVREKFAVVSQADSAANASLLETEKYADSLNKRNFDQAGNEYALDTSSLSQIFQKEWVEILLVDGKDWMIDDPCDCSIPQLSVCGDILDFSDGCAVIFLKYKITAVDSDSINQQWLLRVTELTGMQNDVPADTLIIYLKRVDEDKMSWRFGDPSRNDDFKGTVFTLVNNKEYPRIANDCSGFKDGEEEGL